MTLNRVVILAAVCFIPGMISGCDWNKNGPQVGEIQGQGTVEVEINGAIATLQAIPGNGWEFTRWEGPHDTSTENPHNIGASRLPYFTAVFSPTGDDTGQDDDGDDDDGQPDDDDDQASDDDQSDDPDSDDQDDDSDDDEEFLASFKVVGEDIQERFFQAASLLDDGSVMVSGGMGAELSPPSLLTLDLIAFYDPATEEFSTTFSPLDGSDPVTPALNVARSGHTQTTLQDGRVLITGGRTGAQGMDQGDRIADVEIFDPQTGEIVIGPEMDQDRAAHSATLLPDGRVVVAGADTWQIFDPQDDRWESTHDLEHLRSGHAAVLLEDFSGIAGETRVLLVGGEGPGADTMELLNANTGSTVLLDATLAEGVDDLAAVLLPTGRVFIIAGQSVEDGNTLVETYLLDPVADRLEPGAAVPNREGGISDHKAFVIGDYVAVFGGEQQVDGEDTELSYYAIYDITDQAWVEDGTMSFVHDDFAAARLQDGSILLIGGGIPLLGQELPSQEAEIFTLQER